MTGLFVTFEGTEGSGKTTVIKGISRRLEELGWQDNFLVTREPGGSRISEAIREVILNKANTQMDRKTEALLFAASRRQHLVEKILPGLNAGKLVLCDRFVDSSLAYQGAGRKVGVPEVATINQFATGGLQPDLTFYFDLDPIVGLERIRTNRQDEVNRMDEEQLDFYQQVRAEYLKLAQQNPQRIQLIDASLSQDQVEAAVFSKLKKFLEQATIPQD
ncbi:thymidylate kinase [Ligilactobacillus salitolerans]|uniref:Thymidylate kinase n=1 Tax=Ligilactobacillus salitolerans TaxID=1808352 RepID=A0A401IVH8_9LACO|nr:dTMP kinase [Ligilactobacillus salitolerans]GBG95515.1 thymidylate kinase [Ligilactobacillus salitolerans]